MEVEGSLLVMGLCWVSEITQEPNKNPIAFLESLKETLQKFTNLGLDSYEGQVILKDKFLPRCASDIGIKLQELQQQDLDASLAETVQTATNTFHNRRHERKAKAQEMEKMKETRHAHMLATLQGNPMAKPKSLKDKEGGKCLICIQAGHWAKECTNHDRSPKTVETVIDFFWGGSKITADGDCSHEIKRCLLLGRKVITNLDSLLKSRDITLPTKVHLVKTMFFPVVMYGCWELDYIQRKLSTKELMLLNCGVEKTLENPLDCKEIQPVHSKGNQSWVFIERTDAEAETSIFLPRDAKNWLIGKDPDAGKDWRQEKEGMTEDEMVRWHHWLNGHEFE